MKKWLAWLNIGAVFFTVHSYLSISDDNTMRLFAVATFAIAVAISWGTIISPSKKEVIIMVERDLDDIISSIEKEPYDQERDGRFPKQ